MGILSKTIDTVKDVGKGVLTTLLDPTGNTRGSIAAQKLVDEGQGYINKLEAQIGASTEFWADHQKMLGDLYSSAEWKEAALAKEIAQEKAKLKDTSETFNATEYRQKLIDSGQADELYRVYEEKMNKAKDYKLTSGMEYTDTNIKAHIKNHSRTSRNVINRAARQLFNAYGWDKDLFAAFGFGRDRTAVKQEIGDYSFLLQAEDGPIKQRFIEQLTQELNAGEGRFNDIDAKELATMFESMDVDYDPILKDASKRSMGKYGTNAETAKVVNQYANGEYSETFSLLKDNNSGIEYTKIIDNLDAPSAEKFQEDLNTVSAYILNIYNDVGLVKEGGTLNPKDAVEKAMLILLGSEEGPMGQKLKARTTWIGLGVATEYSEMTGREKKELFDALPTILNLMAGIEQATPDQERKMIEQIELAKNEDRQNVLANDLNHPVNVASRVVGGAGTEGKPDYIAPISFTSIEERDAYIKKDKLKFEEKDYAKEDIQRYIDTVSTADIKESTTEDLLGPPEDYSTVEKAMAAQPKLDFSKGAEERYRILQSPEKDSAIAVRKLFDSIADKLSNLVDTSRLEYGNVDIKNYVDDSLTPEQLESFKGASEEEINEAVQRASFTNNPKNLIANVVATLIPISSVEAQQADATLKTSSSLDLNNAINDKTIKRLSNNDLVINNPDFKNKITKENIYTSLKTELLPFLQLVESSGGTALFNKNSTASGNYHFIQDTAKQVLNQVLRFDPSLKNKKWYKDMQTSLKKGWKIGTNNMQDVPLEAQSKLVIAHLLEKKVKNKKGYGDELIIKFVTADTPDEKIEAALNLYYDAWHTAPNSSVRTNATRKANYLFKEKKQQSAGNTFSLLNRDK